MEIKLTEKEQQARPMVCLPLDNMNYLGEEDAEIAGKDPAKSVEGRVRELSPVVGLFKIGFGTFTRFGPDAVKLVQNFGSEAFVDLKYHDIPNTVQDAAEAATMLGAYTFNVHASGGVAMMKAAMAGVKSGVEKYGLRAPLVTAVTVLTSLDEAMYLQTFQPLNPTLAGIDFNKYIDMKKDDEQLQAEFRNLLEEHNLTGVIQKQVYHLATLAQEAGLDGIVCSAADLEAVRDKMPDSFKFVTPGIQSPKGYVGTDQKRVFTPGNAYLGGSTIQVVGRAITDPRTPEEKEKGVVVTPDMRIEAGYAVLQDIAKHL